jgi:membrane-associated phospholipid phosphatase
MIILAVSMFTNGVLKMLFHDPRPFFNTPNIQSLACNTSYGNPSGHSMYFCSAFPMLFYLLIKESIEVSPIPI